MSSHEAGPRTEGTRTVHKSSEKRAGEFVVKKARFNEAEVDRGLVALAIASGNARRASKALAEQGMKVSPQALRDWRHTRYPDRYAELQQRVLPEIRAHTAELHADLAERQVVAAGCLLDDLMKRIVNEEKMELRDQSAAIRNLDVGAGIHTDKSRDLRGEGTTVVHEHRDVAEILRDLRAEGFELPPDAERVIDVAAEEIRGADQG
jgi:hypothetical protein